MDPMVADLNSFSFTSFNLKKKILIFSLFAVFTDELLGSGANSKFLVRAGQSWKVPEKNLLFLVLNFASLGKLFSLSHCLRVDLSLRQRKHSELLPISLKREKYGNKKGRKFQKYASEILF